jgi:hypothetical protein
MLNGLEKTLEQKISMKDRVWKTSEATENYCDTENTANEVSGWPLTPDT